MKVQPELFIKMAADGLSMEACLAHLSAIGWVYSQERSDCKFPSRLVVLGITPCNDQPDAAANELVRVGYWKRDGGKYELIDHADVIRQSLSAQWSKRDKDKRGQATIRAKRKSLASSDDSSDESSATQANYLTTNHAVTEEQARQGNRMGKCLACGHREPLSPVGRCPSCEDWDAPIEEAS